nr:DsbA family protein [Myxococcota bacterium]
MPDHPADEAARAANAAAEILPFASAAPIIIYIDFKSPYAYLAIEPTRRMLARLGGVADWRPFVLDIPSYLGSAKLDKGGKKVAKQSRTQEQWSGVKYAYFDCRRYANLSQKTLRGTVKIWNTDGLATAMLWLKRFEGLAEQCAEGSLLARYIDAIYEPFWKREFDAEDGSMIVSVLEEIGAPSDGFLDYAQGEGAASNARLQAAAFDAGVYGVPTYILPGQSATDPRHEKFFGRENLPRIEWLLGGRQGPAPGAAYPLAPETDDAALARCAVDPGS